MESKTATRACPRCGSSGTEKLSDSRPPGIWQIFGCNECNYVWRSTEDLAGISKLPDSKRGTAKGPGRRPHSESPANAM